MLLAEKNIYSVFFFFFFLQQNHINFKIKSFFSIFPLEVVFDKPTSESIYILSTVIW